MSEKPDLNSEATATSHSYAQTLDAIERSTQWWPDGVMRISVEEVRTLIRRVRDVEATCKHLEKMAFQWQTAAQDVQANASTRIAQLG